MARDPSLLTSTAPTAIVPAQVHIGHVQLRDLIICPRERGVVNYVQSHSIVEHNLNASVDSTPRTTPRTLAKLGFVANTLTSLNIEGTNDTLIAAGGQEAEIHLSYHAPLTSRYRSGILWHYECQLSGSINNSVLLTSLSLTRSNESSAEPRVGISNNDCTIKFYDVPLRGQSKRGLEEVGNLRLDVPVNHSSISPDGRTLLSVGDSSKVFLHQITGGARISFSPIGTLSIPSPEITPFTYSSSLAASFSTAFSSDGSKFAVASQEGVLAVWDVRSTKPLKVFHTDKARMPGGNGAASGWLMDDFFDWSGGGYRAPGWSVRNVKFGGAGKEIMTFTEHTSRLHIVDARTFETDEIIQVPTVRGATPTGPPPSSVRSQSYNQHHPRPPLIPHRHSTSSSRIISESPPRYVPAGTPRRNGYQSQSHIVQALGDTFRIPSPYSPPSSISDSTWRALMSTPHANTQEDYSEILVIPPLGDRRVESDVQALLGSHGIRTRLEPNDPDYDRHHGDDDPNTGSTHGDYEYTPRPTFVGRGNRRGGREEEMEVDELESDCISSHTPSRSSSPSPSTHIPTLSSPGGGGRRLSSPVSSPGLERLGSRAPPEIGYEDDLDIAGTCFDPSGKYIYVASKESVVEWTAKGTDKRWWLESGWV